VKKFCKTYIFCICTQCGPQVPGLNDRFPTKVIYRAAIELRSWKRFSQECKLALM